MRTNFIVLIKIFNFFLISTYGTGNKNFGIILFQIYAPHFILLRTLSKLD